MLPFCIKSSSPEETRKIGQKTASLLHKGGVLALEGDLGAGKTCLIKGIGLGLRVEEEITSPSYAVVSEYKAELEGESLPFYHIDAYRLNGAEDFAALGGEEYLYGKGITVIEWSERIAESLPDYALTIHIEITGENSREIHISNR
ncbi:MAG: tRNA (adenosine(37)-N6)-threonylcarbamoyltransferase complex ATPase subunit type 1 TsaE [Treponema sp.]|jgi:tRNA threonylcarbamoyladenosine biosynthesis protein TsaE|nr:tRNA (adenosine(37)-N6)-threonylcarbamoyltransferase complex ATPase subunit type 1 TsaE [Treponema sp.]